MVGKKVLHVVNIAFVLPYYIGEQFAFFQQEGVEFHVACSPSTFLDEYAKKVNIKAHPINILRTINPFVDLISIFKLVLLIKKEKIDIVIGHTPKGGLLAMIAAKIVGLNKRIYFRHGLMYETSSGFKRKLLIGIEKLTGFLATQVVCVSPSVLKISIEAHLSDPLKNILLNKGTCNGINLAKFSQTRLSQNLLNEIKRKYHIQSNDRVIGYVGRIVNDKGICELLEAWEIIQRNHKNVKLLLVGPFEERDSVSAQVRGAIEQSDTIIHTGLIEEIFPYYGLMDVFVLPSYREGFPTVVLEASAMGIPVLTTKVTGCQDSIVEGITGRFITLEPSDIANKIGFYLNQPNVAKTHGENGRANVAENYSQLMIWNEIKTNLLNS